MVALRKQETTQRTEPVTITLPLPPSANRYWRIYRNRAVKSEEAQNYITQVGWICRTQGITPLDGALSVEIDVYAIVTRDLDNSIKVLSDSLNTHLWFDDSQIYQITARKHTCPRAEYRVVVRVSRMELK